MKQIAQLISPLSIAVFPWGQVDLDISPEISPTLAVISVVLPKGVVRGHPNPLHQKLDARLRMARKKAQLTPSRLALDAGLSDGVVRHIEDAGGIPGIQTVERLTSVLGISPSWLAYGLPQKRLPPPVELADMTATFAERLSAARTLRGLSRKALSKAAELSLTAVSGLESGQVPNVATAERLAKALKLSPGWLAFGAESVSQLQIRSNALPLPR